MRNRSCKSVGAPLKNHHYDEDINYTLQMCQWFLKPIGLWHFILGRCSRLQRAAAVLLVLLCFATLFFIMLPSSHFMFFEEGNLRKKVQLIGPVSFAVCSTIKYCYLGSKRELLEQCIEHIQGDWKSVECEKHRGIMLKYVRISRNLITVCMIFLYTGGISYHTVMQFLTKERDSSNDTVRPLVYPGYDSFLDSQSSPTYEILFVTHCFAAIVTYSITTGAYSLVAIFVNHVCGQIQIQIARLDDLVRATAEKNDDRDPLAVIVYHHVRVLRFSKNIEEAFREICLAEIAESTLLMCCVEYYCLMDWQNSDTIAVFTNFVLLTSFTFNIFIFCYIGEVLHEQVCYVKSIEIYLFYDSWKRCSIPPSFLDGHDQCSHIGAASYEIRWYNLPARKAYDLIMLNAISQYPPKLTAGKIIELSLNTFGAVVKTSVVYLNLLRTFMNW